MISVPTMWNRSSSTPNRSSSTPKAIRPGWLLRGLRPCGPGVCPGGNSSTNAPLTLRIRIDGRRICGIVK